MRDRVRAGKIDMTTAPSYKAAWPSYGILLASKVTMPLVKAAVR